MSIAQRKDIDPKEGVRKYGDVTFADETNKKYPLDTAEHVRAAWDYIHKGKDARKYSPSEVKEMEAKIVSAWKEKINKSGPPSVAEKADMTVELLNLDKPGAGDFTEQDLQELADTYSPRELHEAPLTIGHLSDYPDTRIPAWGWVDKAVRNGRSFSVHIAEFSDALRESMDAGHFKKFSIGAWPPDHPSNPTPGKWHLNHVAILGAVPPHNKGLAPAEYADPSTDLAIIEFADSKVSMNKHMNAVRDRAKAHVKESIAAVAARHLSRLNDQIDDGEDPERMHSTIYDLANDMHGEVSHHQQIVDGMDRISDKTREMSDNKNPIRRIYESFTRHKQTGKESDTVDDADKKAYEDKIADLNSKITEFADKERAAAEKAKSKELRAQVREFCDKHNLTTNKMKELHIEDVLFNVALAQGVVEFAEGNKKSTFDALGEILTTIGVNAPQPGEMEQFRGTDPSVPRGNNLIVAAREYADKHLGDIFKDMEIDEAVSKTLKLHADGKIDLLKTDNH